MGAARTETELLPEDKLGQSGGEATRTPTDPASRLRRERFEDLNFSSSTAPVTRYRQ